MKRILMFLMSTLTAVVLLLGYHTSTSSKAAGGETSFVSTAQAGTSATSPTTTAAATTAGVADPAVAPATTTASTSSAAPSTSSAATKSTTSTVTGDVSDTRWGPVQVQLTVVDGKITNVAVVEYPNGNGKDQEINATALPILVQETITAQSAKIDMVSGATVTSDGYLSSLQSALDKM